MVVSSLSYALTDMISVANGNSCDYVAPRRRLLATSVRIEYDVTCLSDNYDELRDILGTKANQNNSLLQALVGEGNLDCIDSVTQTIRGKQCLLSQSVC